MPDRKEPAAAIRRRSELVVIGLVLALGTALRWRTFHTYADDWDSCEYVLAASGHYLPHSPYILHLWTGMAAGCFLPVDAGLAIANLVSSDAALLLLRALVRRWTGSADAGLVAALALACCPVAVRSSGGQEVYAPQLAWILAALLVVELGRETRADHARHARASRRWRWLGAGMFGAAVATHDGTLFVAPALAAAWWRSSAGLGAEARARDALAMAGAALLVPAVCVGWVATRLLAPDRGGCTALLHYLRGVSPAPQWSELTPAGCAVALRDACARALEQTLGPGSIGAIFAAALAIVASIGRPRFSAACLLYALPYLAYEATIGRAIDRGAYAVFVAPALAALAGAAVALPIATRRPWMSGPLLLAVLAGAAWRPAQHQLEALPRAVDRATYFGAELRVALDWMRRHLPPHAIVMQPLAWWNVNATPCYSGRSTACRFQKHYFLTELRPWDALTPETLTPLTDDHLARFLDADIPVVSLDPDPFAEQPPAQDLDPRRHRWEEARVETEYSGQRRALRLYYLRRA